jgi:hypothetical protein
MPRPSSTAGIPPAAPPHSFHWHTPRTTSCRAVGTIVIGKEGKPRKGWRGDPRQYARLTAGASLDVAKGFRRIIAGDKEHDMHWMEKSEKK